MNFNELDFGEKVLGGKMNFSDLSWVRFKCVEHGSERHYCEAELKKWVEREAQELEGELFLENNRYCNDPISCNHRMEKIIKKWLKEKFGVGK